MVLRGRRYTPALGGISNARNRAIHGSARTTTRNTRNTRFRSNTTRFCRFTVVLDEHELVIRPPGSNLESAGGRRLDRELERPREHDSARRRARGWVVYRPPPPRHRRPQTRAQTPDRRARDQRREAEKSAPPRPTETDRFAPADNRARREVKVAVEVAPPQRVGVAALVVAHAQDEVDPRLQREGGGARAVSASRRLAHRATFLAQGQWIRKGQLSRKFSRNRHYSSTTTAPDERARGGGPDRLAAREQPPPRRERLRDEPRDHAAARRGGVRRRRRRRGRRRRWRRVARGCARRRGAPPSALLAVEGLHLPERVQERFSFVRHLVGEERCLTDSAGALSRLDWRPRRCHEHKRRPVSKLGHSSPVTW